ncbi:MAG: PD40 domain-containing protein [Bryobacterales bacterium]|nr:PD40 domain-containing protein [Bryobacterales bacterium]
MSKRRLIREARAASALNHPRIVTIYDVEQADGIDFIAMEYAAGKNLDRLIPRKGLRLEKTLNYGAQVAEALVAAHAAGIVHRDIKPSNIMISDQGNVKVLDFGLAKRMDVSKEGTTTPTVEGVILGTVAYMSPEQAQGKEVDARSDIFSFGSTLYEMAAGRQAFQVDSSLSTLLAIIDSEPAPLPADIPRDLEKLIQRCLRKDPAQRIQHMDDVKLALEELSEELNSGRLADAGPQPRRFRRKLAWAIAALAVVATAFTWLYVRSTPAAPWRAVPLTAYMGMETCPTFSPDGSQVAFSWNGEREENFDIYLRLVKGGTPMRLTTDPARDVSPAWSPDGSSIAFVRLVPNEKALVIVIPALGGQERKLAEINLGVNDVWEYSQLDWSPDSSQLVIVDRGSPGEPTGLFLLSVVTRDKRRLLTPPVNSQGDSRPALSPDGRVLAFVRFPGSLSADLYALALSEDFRPKGEPVRLTFHKAPIQGAAWMPDGHRILYARDILRMVSSSSPGKPKDLPEVGQSVASPAISRGAPGGARLAYALYHGGTAARYGIWRAGVPNPAAKAAAPVSFISSSRGESRAEFSPDGKKIAFSSARSGSSEIWVCDRDGSNAVPLTSFGGPVTDGTDWSPDGRRIAFHSRAEGQAEIYSISSEGGVPRRLTNSPADDVVPRWSQDGEWIYFGSNRGGRYEVWKMPAEGGTALPVTKNGGLLAEESPDRKYLYYTKIRGTGGLWKMPLAGGGPETRVLESIFYGSFALRPEGIFYFPGEFTVGQTTLQFFSFATGTTRTILRFERARIRSMPAVSPDGQTLLYAEMAPPSADLMLVEDIR